MLYGFFGLGSQEIVLLLGCGCFLLIPVIAVLLVLKLAKKKTPPNGDYDEMDD